MKATNVYAEEEVEYDVRVIMDVVRETLETVYSEERSARLVLWQTPFYDIKVIIMFALILAGYLKFQYCFIKC